LSPGKHSSLFRRSIGDDGEKKVYRIRGRKIISSVPRANVIQRTFLSKKKKEERERDGKREREEDSPSLFSSFQAYLPGYRLQYVAV
jgi:hypothetical protein